MGELRDNIGEFQEFQLTSFFVIHSYPVAPPLIFKQNFSVPVRTFFHSHPEQNPAYPPAERSTESRTTLLRTANALLRSAANKSMIEG